MYKHLNGNHLANYSTGAELAEVDINTGKSSQEKWEEEKVVQQLYIQGWVGFYVDPIESSTCECDSSVNLVSSTHVPRCATKPSQPLNNDLTEEFERFWDLESLRISSLKQSDHSHFIACISLQLGRYEVHLPWRNIHPVLPDNYETSHKRLMSLLNRLRREPQVLLEYDAVIRH